MIFLCKNKVIVVSGINLYEGGAISVYKDFVRALIEKKIIFDNKVILFVHKRELFDELKGMAEVIEMPKSRKNYINRLYYEYIFFWIYSRDKKIDYWISLHDITPNVCAKNLYTYCHNPAPFYKLKSIDWKFNKKLSLFSILYKYLYAINIKENNSVIVQQAWIRKEFKKMYGISNIIVASPQKESKDILENEESSVDTYHSVYRFIYPSYPRTPKNFEVIGEACRYINNNYNYSGKYEVLFTLDGTENKYSRYLKTKYQDIEEIKWIGIQNRQCLMKLYRNTDCMVFPSRLETWGLPISEYKETLNPIILSDLPYAHETIGEYGKVVFFDYNDKSDLARIMVGLIKGENICYKTEEGFYDVPYAKDWNSLCDILFADKER